MDQIPNERINPNLALVWYYMFKIIPMLISGGAIYLGYRLFILGVTGQASLSIQNKDVSGQLLNAAPGLFFAIGGIVAIIIIVWKGVRLSFAGPAAPLQFEPSRTLGKLGENTTDVLTGLGENFPTGGGFVMMEFNDIKDALPKTSEKDIER